MKLAIFDFDGTLFPKETIPFLLSQWKKQHYSKKKLLKVYLPLLPMYLNYKTGIIKGLSKEHIRIKAIRQFNHIFIDMSEEEVNQFFYHSFENLKNTLNQNVVKEIQNAIIEGYHPVLLSGAHQILLSHVGKYVNIESIIGSKLQFKEDGYDHRKDSELISGSNKIQKLKEYFKDYEIDWKASKAYADSLSDLPLLESVGVPCAVTPDKELLNVALSRDWDIIH